MKKTACLALAPLPLLAGCVLEEPPPLAPSAEPPLPPAEPVVVSTVAMAGGRPLPTSYDVPRASEADRVRPAPVFFKLGAGYGAVGQVDLSPCRVHGLDPGYVHLHVTFAGSGAVARASVESLTQPSPEALACIGRQLEEAAVPAFEGGDFTLSKNLYVSTPAAGAEVLVRSDVTPRSGARRMTIAP